MRDDDQSIPRLHDRKTLEDEARQLAAYARGEREVDQFGGPRPRPVPRTAEQKPYTPYETDTFSGHDFGRHPTTVLVNKPTATVTPLNPPKQPSLQDEILSLLDELTADIRSGKVTPLHLILSYGDDKGDSIAYEWHGLGMNRFELIGHLTAEATALAMEIDQ